MKESQRSYAFRERRAVSIITAAIIFLGLLPSDARHAGELGGQGHKTDQAQAVIPESLITSDPHKVINRKK